MKIPGALVLAAFFLCSAADLAACARHSARAEHIAKPLLMPLLLCWYCVSAAELHKAPDTLIVLALFCGFLGDTFLLGSGIRFVCGLGSFLLGQIFYAAAFLRPLDLRSVPAAVPLGAAPVYIAYAAVIGRAVLPLVEKKEKPAAAAYLVCLLGMSFSALLRCGSAGGPAFWLPFLGSLLFVASDSMLALQIYRKSGGNSGAAVMITYLLAQLMIAGGMLL